MRPALGDLGRTRVFLLGLLGALKALGLVLLADGVAGGIAAIAAHHTALGSLQLALAGTLVRAGASWALTVAASHAAGELRERLRGRLLRRSIETDAPLGGTTALATTALDELEQYTTVYLPALVSAATVPLLVGVRILFADWVSALIVVVTVPLVPVFMILIGVRTRELVGESVTTLARLSDHLVELARGLPVLVGLGRVEAQTTALRDISEQWRRRSLATLRVAFLSALALELISTVSVALVAVFVGVRLVNGSMGLDAGLIALVLAPECFAPLRDVGSAFHSAQTGVEARRRVDAALEEPVVVPQLQRVAVGAGGAGGSDVPAAAAGTGAEAAAALSVADLTIRHEGRLAPAVAALSFTVPAGAIATLDGPSGSGKSSVLAVLAGRGALLTAGSAVQGRVAAPDAVAYLPQHPHFAATSARAELELYGAVDAAHLLAAVGLAALADADPARLSPGEQRRLAVARVLARIGAGARLALLDEPTAHLDEGSADAVRTVIAGLAGRATVLIASHDPELRALATQRIAVAPAAGAGRAAPAGEPSDPAAPRSAPARASGTVSGPFRTGPEEVASTARTLSGAADRVPAETTGAAGTPRAATAPAIRRELLAFLRPVRLRMLGAIGVGALAALFAAALTAVSGWLIVRASEHPHILYLEVAIVGVRFFGIGRAALRYSERLLTHDAIFAALTGLRMRLWRGLAAQGPSGRTALTPGNALGRLIGDADAVRDLAPRVIVPPLTGAVTALGAVVALWILQPAAGVIALALAVAGVVAVPLLVIAADARAGRRRDAARDELVRETALLLGARDELAANGSAERVLARVERAGAVLSAASLRAAWATGAAAAAVVAACGAASAAMLALGPSVHAPIMAVLVLTPLALIDPLLDVAAAAQRWPVLRQVLARVAPVTQAGDVPEPGGSAVDGAVSRLELDDVSYRYPDAEADALRGVTAAVERGSWLVVAGPSGSGKSTLLGVLLRYLAPRGGRYLLDDARGTRDAAALDPASLRRHVAWAPQEGHLFHSTLRGNLALARSRDDAPSDAELHEALERVGLGPLLAELPEGLDTPLGSEGAHLSGGQRQRVAVARTLLAGGDALLLDEPTAHLDEESAHALLADLRAALSDRVVVLVTHHPEDAAGRDLRLRVEAPGASARLDVVPPA